VFICFVLKLCDPEKGKNVAKLLSEYWMHDIEMGFRIRSGCRCLRCWCSCSHPERIPILSSCSCHIPLLFPFPSESCGRRCCFVTVWFWHWRIPRHLSCTTPLKGGRASERSEKDTLGLARLCACVGLKCLPSWWMTAMTTARKPCQTLAAFRQR